MSLTPRKTINFDGVGLADDDDYVLDGSGVGHFHIVKAGSTWKFRLKITGIDVTDITFTMDVRIGIAATTAVLSTGGTGDAIITMSKNPDGDDVEELEISVTAAGTLLLQSAGTGQNFVWDLKASEGGEADIWFGGSGSATPAVTR
tara:strand:+ start:22861 stop:23298 length:438 start_codon:yes stop_codon:yes gene_type:complete